MRRRASMLRWARSVSAGRVPAGADGRGCWAMVMTRNPPCRPHAWSQALDVNCIAPPLVFMDTFVHAEFVMSSKPAPDDGRPRALASMPEIGAASGAVGGVVSAQAAAALIGVHERTIRRAIRRGELTASRQGRRFAIELDALERYRRQHHLLHGDHAPDRPHLALAPAPPVPLFEPPRPPTIALPAALTAFIGRERELASVT